MIWSGRSKIRLAKAAGAGAEPAGHMRNEKLHALVARRAYPRDSTKHTMIGPLLEVKMSNKVHAIVARSTFPSHKPAPDHFWKLTVEMLKKCTN